MPIEGGRQVAEFDVSVDPPLRSELFYGGIHVDGVPGDNGVCDQVEAEGLVRLLIGLAALHLALAGEEQEATECV